jgi:hypothetical protein
MNASNEYFDYALCAAVYRGNTDIISVLLDYETNPSIEGVLGTPLQIMQGLPP